MNIFSLGKGDLDKLDMVLESVLKRERFYGRLSRNEMLYLRESKVAECWEDWRKFLIKQKVKWHATWLIHQKKKKNCAEFYHGNRKSNKKRWKRQQHLMKKVQLLAKAERTMKKLKKINKKQIFSKNEFQSDKRTNTVKNTLAASNVTVTPRKHYQYLYYSDKW